MAKKRSGIAKALGGLAILSAGIYAVVKFINKNKDTQSESCDECTGCDECDNAINITENEDIEETTEKTEEEKIN